MKEEAVACFQCCREITGVVQPEGVGVGQISGWIGPSRFYLIAVESAARHTHCVIGADAGYFQTPLVYGACFCFSATDDVTEPEGK